MSKQIFDAQGFVKQDLASFSLNVEDAYEVATNYIDNVVSSAKVSGRDINYSAGEINSFHALEKCPELVNLYMKSGLLDLVGELLGEEVEIRGAELFAKPAKVGLPSPWHQDNFYWCLERAAAVTVWIACAPVGPLNGGISYLSGSHLLGTLDHEDSNAPGSSQTVRADLLANALLKHDQVTHHLEKNQFLVHHSNTIHGSGKNESVFPRTALTIQLKAKNDRYNQKMLDHYNGRLAEQVSKRSSASK